MLAGLLCPKMQWHQPHQDPWPPHLLPPLQWPQSVLVSMFLCTPAVALDNTVIPNQTAWVRCLLPEAALSQEGRQGLPGSLRRWRNGLLLPGPLFPLSPQEAFPAEGRQPFMCQAKGSCRLTNALRSLRILPPGEEFLP